MRIKKKLLKTVVGSIVVSIKSSGHIYKCPKTENTLSFIPPEDDSIGCIMITDCESHNYLEIYYDNEENRKVVEVLYNDPVTPIEFNGYLYSMVDDTHYSITKK